MAVSVALDAPPDGQLVERLVVRHPHPYRSDDHDGQCDRRFGVLSHADRRDDRVNPFDVLVDELACLGTEDRSEGGMMNETTFDSNGRIVEQVVDNGDGTGTRTTYDADGNVTSVEQLTGLPIPVEPEPDPVEVLQAQVQAQQATIDALLDALGGSDG